LHMFLITDSGQRIMSPNGNEPLSLELM
jgi:hypothetical protein